MSTQSPETATHEEQRADGAGRFERGDTPAAMPSGTTSGRATAALILGILSIPAALLPILGFIVGIVALVLGITAKGDIRRRGLTNMSHAKWGVILSCIGLLLTVANAVVGAIMATS